MTNLVQFPGLGLSFELDRVAFSIGGADIYWYGVCIAFGLCLALVFAFRRCTEFGIDADSMVDVILVGVVLGIASARLYYVAMAPYNYDTIWDVLAVRDGGLAIYGGIIGAFVFGGLACKWRGVPVLPMFDLAGMGFLIGQGCGRWGNFFNQEAFGCNTTLPWGMFSEATEEYLMGSTVTVPKGVTIDPTMPVHPTFLYESIWCFVGLALLTAYIKKRKFNGDIALRYLIWYGAGRFWIEGLRTDSLLLVPSLGLRASQLVAAAAVVGGDIIFVVDDHLTTLMDFRYKRKYTADEGGKGGASLCHGKNAENLVIKVPLGTVIKDAESGLVIADLSDHTPVTVAKGGRGGYGNAHFATPTRQIPKFAKPGMPGEDIQVTLELKLIADVGLIGFPNVGKSTLISTISAAKPKIANYHFTTLVPTLGVVSVGEGASFVCADIPGLIEGASEGVGLGHDFLRHVERCRLLLHVVDVSGSECRDPIEDFEKINEELAKFSPALAERPQIVVGNKCDLATEEQIDTFRKYVEEKGLTFVPISAATMQGVRELPGLVYNRLKDIPAVPVFAPEYKKPEAKAGGREFTIKRVEAHVWSVDAPWLEYILAGSNVDDYESLQYFQRQLGESGILDALVQKGVQENDTILIGEYQFDYIF